MKSIYNNKVLTTYFLIQPLVDIATGIMKNYFSISISLAMIVRTLFIFYCAFYILKNRNKKINAYIIIWVLYVIISCIGNYYIKDSFNIIIYLYNIFKFSYFSICLLFFYLYFKENKMLNTKVFSNMGLILGVSLIISYITKTSFCAYPGIEDCLRRGYQGYVFSSNEYGVILLLLLGYNMIFYMKKKNIRSIISLTLVCLYLLLIGTKTAFLGILIILTLFTLYHLIISIINLSKRKDNKLIILFIIFLTLIGITYKRLPIYFNINLVKDFTEEVIKNKYQVELKDSYTINGKEPNETITQEELDEYIKTTIIYSERDEFLKNNKELYKKSNIFNKLFGLTTQGNYLNGIKIVSMNERDPYDIFIFYGIIGFIIELLLPLSIIVASFKKIIKNIKIMFENDFVILSLIFALSMMISYMAGHTLLNPSVSWLVAYIIINIRKKVDES